MEWYEGKDGLHAGKKRGGTFAYEDARVGFVHGNTNTRGAYPCEDEAEAAAVAAPLVPTAATSTADRRRRAESPCPTMATRSFHPRACTSGEGCVSMCVRVLENGWGVCVYEMCGMREIQTWVCNACMHHMQAHPIHASTQTRPAGKSAAGTAQGTAPASPPSPSAPLPPPPPPPSFGEAAAGAPPPPPPPSAARAGTAADHPPTTALAPAALPPPSTDALTIAPASPAVAAAACSLRSAWTGARRCSPPNVALRPVKKNHCTT